MMMMKWITLKGKIWKHISSNMDATKKPFQFCLIMVYTVCMT